MLFIKSNEAITCGRGILSREKLARLKLSPCVRFSSIGGVLLFVVLSKCAFLAWGIFRFNVPPDDIFSTRFSLLNEGADELLLWHVLSVVWIFNEKWSFSGQWSFVTRITFSIFVLSLSLDGFRVLLSDWKWRICSFRMASSLLGLNVRGFGLKKLSGRSRSTYLGFPILNVGLSTLKSSSRGFLSLLRSQLKFIGFIIMFLGQMSVKWGQMRSNEVKWGQMRSNEVKWGHILLLIWGQVHSISLYNKFIDCMTCFSDQKLYILTCCILEVTCAMVEMMIVIDEIILFMIRVPFLQNLERESVTLTSLS